ncbi:MAG TPA: transcriptional regulator [Gammaproteobacteria bacterium]|nr:transcriptional regulator [Gammaproteobacteria bacterium]
MEANKIDKSSQENFKTNTLPVPPPVRRAIEKLGADIALARRRRRISQASLAERMGASVSTVKRLENGDLRVPIHFIARALHVFGEIERLANLLDTAEDAIDLALMDDQLPQRIRTRKLTPDAGAL